MPKAFVLAGTHSGCGKTSVALGLLRALSRRGLRVQPFKAGPDFIDPGLHSVAAGQTSHNLDTWMQPEPALRALFSRHAREADVVIVEGVMGLFDGRSGLDEAGSTAHLAKLLGLPVLLVVDTASQARSVAALVQGFARFDKALPLAGVLLNRVGSPRHEGLLREALTLVPEAPLLGCLGRSAGLALPSRHLGLVTATDSPDLAATLDALADWVEQGIDLSAVLSAFPDLSLPAVLAAEAVSTLTHPAVRPTVRLGLAQDRAFCFVYQENLRLLEQAGAHIVPFSPLADAELPQDLDGLILPGGYPELAAPELSANTPLRAAIRAFCSANKPVWAECGGYMYLLDELTDANGTAWPMCGAVPGRAIMTPRRTALGYREARTLADGPFGQAGTLLRGHEFHYSRLDGAEATHPAWRLTASDGTSACDGWAQGNIVGGYFHAHLASNPEAARRFVEACRGE
jgi:cobyrinic acid a,c-diamide synthase